MDSPLFIEELAHGLQTNGFMNPIHVFYKPDGSFELIEGRNRFLAWKNLGYVSIPARVRGAISGGTF